jgi:hypothetical protein
MPYRKRSDLRTMALPQVTEEFKLAVDHLMVYRHGTITDMAVASGLTADLDKLDQALRWLVNNRFIRYTNARYTRELRLKGLERRLFPKKPEPKRWPGEGLAKHDPAHEVKTPGPRLLLLQTR